MLINGMGDHVRMLVYIVIALVAVFLPLAYLRGADSRIDDIARRRRYNG